MESGTLGMDASAAPGGTSYVDTSNNYLKVIVKKEMVKTIKNVIYFS